MRRVVRLRPIRAPEPSGVELFGIWSDRLVVTGPLGEPQMALLLPPLSAGAHPESLSLWPVGRLVRLAAPQPASDATPATPTSESRTSPGVYTLRPIRHGHTYAMTSPPAQRLVRPELAEALETVFERLARERGYTPEKPLAIRLTRGFKVGSHGHGEGRAADIAAVGGKGLLAWKQEWDQAMATADQLPDEQRTEAVASEQKRNLGYALYKALQDHGGWRVNPQGWRPYRGVMQLFGPWTATEGPWRALQVATPNPYQRQRLVDQQWVFQAHQDHIHVAR